MFHRSSDSGTGLPPQVSVGAAAGPLSWSRRSCAAPPGPHAVPSSSGRGRLSPHQAVNRLVLARACAYVGALAAGVYLGYAVSWLGVSSTDLAGQRAFRSACAGFAGVLIVVGGLLLERACRVPPEDDEP